MSIILAAIITSLLISIVSETLAKKSLKVALIFDIFLFIVFLKIFTMII